MLHHQICAAKYADNLSVSTRGLKRKIRDIDEAGKSTLLRTRSEDVIEVIETVFTDLRSAVTTRPRGFIFNSVGSFLSLSRRLRLFSCLSLSVVDNVPF